MTVTARDWLHSQMVKTKIVESLDGSEGLNEMKRWKMVWRQRESYNYIVLCRFKLQVKIEMTDLG